MTTTVQASGELSRPRSIWHRRLVAPLLAQLTQGTTPEKLSVTLALGAVCSLFPFLGFTSLLNLAAGLFLRLNQAILQTLNQLLGPLQLVMILLYVRAGAWLWQSDAQGFAVTELIHTFREASLAAFLREFGWAGVHAFTAWLATAPALFAVIYFAVRPALRRAAARR